MSHADTLPAAQLPTYLPDAFIDGVVLAQPALHNDKERLGRRRPFEGVQAHFFRERC